MVGRTGGTICGMLKTTVYVPEELDARLNAEAAATGQSKAQLIRTAIEQLLESSPRGRLTPLPVFTSGRPRTAEEMDHDLYQHIKEQAGRR